MEYFLVLLNKAGINSLFSNIHVQKLKTPNCFVENITLIKVNMTQVVFTFFNHFEFIIRSLSPSSFVYTLRGSGAPFQLAYDVDNALGRFD